MEPRHIFSDFIRKEGTEAHQDMINAILYMAKLLKTSFGPLGMRKMIIEKYGTIIISNDGLTIIKDIGVSHPAAESLIQMGKSFINEVGDGLKTTIILIGELLVRGQELIQKNIHPQTIISGYNLALRHSIQFLKELAISLDKNDENKLKDVAKNALNGKFSEKVIDHLANIAIKALNSILVKKFDSYEIDIDRDIQFQKVIGGGILDTKIIDGILISKDILNPKMPRTVVNARIALINEKLYFEKPTGDDLKVEISLSRPELLPEMKRAREEFFQKKADAIIKSGANVVVTEKGIDKIIISKLVEHRIMGIRRAKPEQIKMLSKACGAKIIGNTFDMMFEDLGCATNVEEILLSKDKFVIFEGCRNPKSVCILIRGGSWYVCEEVERLLKNAIHCVSQIFNADYKGVVGGGGAIEIEISKKIKEFATTIHEKEQMVVEEFGKALEIIPQTLAASFGLDSIDTLAELRHLHSKGNIWMGLASNKLAIANVYDSKIVEPLFNKISVLKYAAEFANSILRIDKILFSKMGLKKIKENT